MNRTIFSTISHSLTLQRLSLGAIATLVSLAALCPEAWAGEAARYNRRGDLGKNIGIGAAAGVVGGTVNSRDSVVTDAINGAVTGAAVHAVRSGRRPDTLRDIGVGAAANTAIGAITGRNKPLTNAVNGAATGAAIHILNR
jgi:hypothetical protein